MNNFLSFEQTTQDAVKHHSV